MTETRMASSRCLCRREPPAEARRRLATLEDAAALRLQSALGDELVHRGAGLERRIELPERLRPELARVQMAIDVATRIRIADRKRADVGGILADHAIAKIKDVQAAPPRSWS